MLLGKLPTDAIVPTFGSNLPGKLQIIHRAVELGRAGIKVAASHGYYSKLSVLMLGLEANWLASTASGGRSIA
jgi:hypothetical protein